MIDGVIDGVLSVLIGLIIFITLVELWMGLVDARKFIEAIVVVLLLIVVRVRVRMVDGVIDGMLTVLVWIIIFVTLVQLGMALMVACVFIEAIVVLLFVAVSVRVMEKLGMGDMADSIVAMVLLSVMSRLTWHVRA